MVVIGPPTMVTPLGSKNPTSRGPPIPLFRGKKGRPVTVDGNQNSSRCSPVEVVLYIPGGGFLNHQQ